MPSDEDSGPERPAEKAPEQAAPSDPEAEEAVRGWEAAHLEVIREALAEIEDPDADRGDVVSEAEERMYDVEPPEGVDEDRLPSLSRYLRALYDLTGHYGTVSVLARDADLEEIRELLVAETWLSPTSMEYPSVLQWRSLYLLDGPPDFRERALEALEGVASELETLPLTVRAYPVPRDTSIEERPFCSVCTGPVDVVLEVRNLGAEEVTIPPPAPGQGWRLLVRNPERDEALPAAEPGEGGRTGGGATVLEPGGMWRRAVSPERLLAEPPGPGIWEVDAVLSLEEGAELVASTPWAKRIEVR